MITLKCLGRKFEGIEAVIFDKDGTLADSQSYLIQLALTRSEMFEEIIPNIQSPLLKAWGVSAQQLLPHGLMAVGTCQDNQTVAAGYLAARGIPWLDALELSKTCFGQADRLAPTKPPNTPLFPGTQEMLAQLSARPVRLGIISADSDVNVREFVEFYRLGRFLDVWAGARTGLPDKPDPTVFYSLCKTIESRPSATLIIGDSKADLMLARNGTAAGFISVAAFLDAPALLGADAAINNWADLTFHE